MYHTSHLGLKHQVLKIYMRKVMNLVQKLNKNKTYTSFYLLD